MNRINTVGDLRAAIAGMPNETTLRPAIAHYQAPQPGLYLIRIAAGTCNPEYAEVHIEPQGFTGTACIGTPGMPFHVTPGVAIPDGSRDAMDSTRGEVKP